MRCELTTLPRMNHAGTSAEDPDSGSDDEITQEQLAAAAVAAERLEEELVGLFADDLVRARSARHRTLTGSHQGCTTPMMSEVTRAQIKTWYHDGGTRVTVAAIPVDEITSRWQRATNSRDLNAEQGRFLQDLQDLLITMPMAMAMLLGKDWFDETVSLALFILSCKLRASPCLWRSAAVPQPSRCVDAEWP